MGKDIKRSSGSASRAVQRLGTYNKIPGSRSGREKEKDIRHEVDRAIRGKEASRVNAVVGLHLHLKKHQPGL